MTTSEQEAVMKQARILYLMVFNKELSVSEKEFALAVIKYIDIDTSFKVGVFSMEEVEMACKLCEEG